MYTIIRDDFFEKEFVKIAENYPSKIADLEAAIDWALARGYDSDLFFRVDNTNHFLWRFLKISTDLPQLLILFKVDYEEETVTLLNVKELTQ